MALTVGELVAYLRADDRDYYGPLQRAKRALKDVGDDAEKMGNRLDRAAGTAFRAANAVAKIGAAVGAISAVQGAVSGLSGVLGVIPGIAAAAAAALATIKIGTSGMGKAIANLGKSSGGGGGGGGGGAEKAISDARRIADAERSVQRAQEQVTEAQDNLTRARQRAARAIEDLQDRLKHQALDEESASLAVERARERLNKVRTTEGSSALDMKEAELGVRQAEAALADTKKEYADLGAEAAEAQRKGVDGSDEVISAQKGVQDALRGVEDAQRNLAEAQQDAARGAAAAAGGGGAANEEFNKLSRNAKEVALAIHGLSGEWLKVKQATQDALFAGVASDIKTLGARYLPVAKVGFSGIATEINKGARETAAYLAESRQVNDVAGIFGNVRKAIGDTSKTAKPLTSILLDITSVSAEMLPGMTKGFGGAAQSAADFVKHARETGQLKQWIQTGIDTAKKLWEVLKNVGEIVGTIWKAFRVEGAGALDTLIKLTGKIKDFLKSAEGQAGLKALADIMHTVADVGGGVLMEVLKAVSKILVDTSPQIQDVTRWFGEFLTGAIQKLTPLLIGLVKWIGDNINWLGPLAVALYGAVKAFEAVNAIMKITDAIGKGSWWGVIIAATIALVTLIVTHWDQIKQAVSDAWEWIKQRASDVWGWIKRNIIDNITAAAQWISDKFMDIVNWFKDLPGRLWRAIGSWAKTLWDAGVQLIQGVIDGIESMVGTLIRKITGLAGEVSRKMVQIFQIGSPSKLFAYYGQMLGAGLAQGIEGSTRDVLGAAAGMTDAATIDIPAPRTDPMPLGGPGPGGLAPAPAGAAAGGRPMVVIKADGTRGGAAVLEFFRESIRDQGGDVQFVLGQ